MRALFLHNYYQIRGGEDEVFEAEVKLLQANHHEVATYTQNNDAISQMPTWQAGLETIWSRPSRQRIRQLITQGPYDVVHAHNTFPLISPAVYGVAREADIPVVQTLHNYRLFCANALFFRDGQVCEDCFQKTVPIAGIKHGCYRDSTAASAVVSGMLMTHRWLKTWTEQVDCYIALTEFARQKCIAGGLPADKIRVKPNFVDPDPGVGDGDGKFMLFVGRLSPEKGLDTLLQAWSKLKRPYQLKIVGDGPLSDKVAEAAKMQPEIEWLGRQPLSKVYDLMGAATGLIFPSQWYESFGRVATEAFARGTPVVAANIGAIAELVEDGVTGLRFQPGDAEDLALKVDALLDLASTSTGQSMRQAARAEFLAKYTADQNHKQLLEIYAHAKAMLKAA